MIDIPLKLDLSFYIIPINFDIHIGYIFDRERIGYL